MKAKTDKVKLDKNKRRIRLKNDFDAWVLLMPAVFVMFIFIWRSTVIGGIWSFFDMKGYTPAEFCGLDNYRKVVTHTQFFPMLWNTVKYVLWSLAIGYLPPLIFAIILNEIIHFRNGFRALVYIPAALPGIATMLIWYFIYSPGENGMLNTILVNMGLKPYQWLNDPNFAILGIIIYMTWKSFAGTMLLYFAALQSISSELYEAAIIDGAGPWKRVWNVTRPAIEGILLLNLVRQIIGVFQIMQEPMTMTSGGPNGASTSLSYQLYQYGFNSGGRGTGQAMALGVIIFVILMVFTCFYFYLDRKIQKRS